jgi:hypothetical protein
MENTNGEKLRVEIASIDSAPILDLEEFGGQAMAHWSPLVLIPHYPRDFALEAHMMAVNPRIVIVDPTPKAPDPVETINALVAKMSKLELPPPPKPRSPFRPSFRRQKRR